MIVWFNCKISDIRPNPQPRFHLRNDNRFDIARYSFASFVPLAPLVTKFIFNLEMADGHAHQQQEMEDWLHKIFPSDKLSLHWHRCNNISQWREVQEEINATGDQYVFPAGNEDHIFMDSSIDVFRNTHKQMANDGNQSAAIMTSHWPESIRAAAHFDGIHASPSVKYTIGNNDALRVMKKVFFDWYLDQVNDPAAFIFRTEHWNSVILPQNTLYIPTKEQFRHFDGYAHVGIGPDYVPPLEIPPGFFQDGITIRYGFADRDPNCVNINPMSETLYAADGVGADYKFTLADIPAFWKPFIKDIIIAPDIDDNAMAQARDTYMLETSRLTFNWPHMNVSFNDTNYPPVDWINPHTLVSEFRD